ncbi:hypothetical protein [Paludisphaera borealis]|uniref:AsmA-like C-terminal domain-containing protein n=1 Tax=Paludisphaera borealis TaxID=1387353 RepID=A0A1U7CUX8_9BACT|nr:hypothetical protein [Paludisphaera borealis]APW62731.1 hypothetical protein BSF38_04283 [Paludisphaera borealis]
MFPLSRPFRQGLATAALVAATVLPTVFVAAYAWRINRPGHIRDVEIVLGRQLGLQVTLDAVLYPQPGEVVYRGIVLRQEEPRGKGLVEIARAGMVRLVRSDRELTIHAEGLALRGESPKLAMAQIGTLIQRSGELAFDHVSLTAPTCQVDLGDGLGFSVQDVAGAFSADQAKPMLRVAYRLVEPGSKTRCELTLTRDRASDPVGTSLVLKTLEGLPPPARVLNVFFDATGWMGERAKVDGVLTLRQSGSREWEGDFTGDLLDVDLGTLVGRRFPRHRLAGPARVAVHKARWGDRPGQGPGWLEAKGKLSAGQGAVGVDLLAALSREMKFRLTPRASRVDPRRTEVEFGSLGLEFDIQANGEIQLAGALGDGFPPDAVLAGGGNALAYAPQGAANVYGLIKTLFPVADSPPGSLVPLTTESRVLLCLPIAPDIASKGVRSMDAN